MSHFTTYDFTESLSRESIEREDIKRVVAAFGGPVEWDGWSGGFLMEMKSGKFLYLTGWCDYTGWGCQDGTSKTEYETLPALADLKAEYEWEEDPADLNRYVQTGEGRLE
jgi:hypothetical protein